MIGSRGSRPNGLINHMLRQAQQFRHNCALRSRSALNKCLKFCFINVRQHCPQPFASMIAPWAVQV